MNSTADAQQLARWGNMDFLYYGVFFVVYGFAFWNYSRLVAKRRVAALTDRLQFGAGLRILSFLGLLFLAIAPPLTELFVRLSYGRLDDVAFLAFGGAWLVSALPGVLAGRRVLKAGGIDPDEGA